MQALAVPCAIWHTYAARDYSCRAGPGSIFWICHTATSTVPVTAHGQVLLAACELLLQPGILAWLLPWPFVPYLPHSRTPTTWQPLLPTCKHGPAE